MHPTLSPNKMIVGSMIAGNDNYLLKHLIEAIRQAKEASHALKAHRDLLQRDRALRAQQDKEFQASEACDRAKHTQTEVIADRPQDPENETELGESLDDTEVDTEEIRKRRLARIHREEYSKHPHNCESDGDGCGDSIVTFKNP